MEGWRRLVRTDPLNFARKVLRLETLWWGAENIISSVFNHPRTAICSGHSLSKDWAAGIIALQWLLTFYPSKVICTAPKLEQVKKIMFEEISKQYRRLFETIPWKIRGEPMKTLSLEFGPEWYAFGMTTKEAGSNMGKFQGFKSPNLLVIMTEAQDIPDNIYDQLYGITTSGNARILEIGNPILISGRFWEHCTQAKWDYNVIHMSCLESPNVIEGYEKIPGLVTSEWVNHMRRIWGESHPYWFSRVLGQFPQASSKALIPMDWIMRAVNREIQDNDLLKTGGHDVAKFGTAETVITILTGRRVTRVEAFHKMDINEQVGWAKAIIREEKVELYAVDEGGLAGIAGFLEEERLSALRVSFGAESESEDFANLAAMMWWQLRKSFENNEISIPDDEILIGQLAGREFEFTSRGKRKISLEPKGEAAKRGQHFYDRADSLVLAWWARISFISESLGPSSEFISDAARLDAQFPDRRRRMANKDFVSEAEEIRY